MDLKMSKHALSGYRSKGSHEGLICKKNVSTYVNTCNGTVKALLCKCNPLCSIKYEIDINDNNFEN